MGWVQPRAVRRAAPTRTWYCLSAAPGRCLFPWQPADRAPGYGGLSGTWPVDRTYTCTTCHCAPGGGPVRRAVDVYVLSTLPKTRSDWGCWPDISGG